MKKLIAIVMACLLIMVFSSALVVSASTEQVLTYEEADAKAKLITELYSERDDAELAGDFTKSAQITEKLASLGVEQMTYTEMCEMLNLPMPMYVVEYDNIRYEQYSDDVYIGGEIYTYMVVNITPKTEKCNLIIKNIEAIRFTRYMESVHDTVIDAIGVGLGEIPVLGEAITILDYLQSAHVNFNPESEVGNVQAVYLWNLVESCSFTFVASETVNGLYIPTGRYNKVKGSIGGLVSLLDYDEELGETIPDMMSETYNIEEYRAKNFGNPVIALHYHLETLGVYEERLEKVEVKGLKDELIKTVDLLCPDSPNMILT